MTPSRQRDVRFLRFGIRRADAVSAHSHPTHQLLHVERGALAFTHRLASWVIPSGGAIWLPAGGVHRLEALEDADVTALYVRPRPTDRFVDAGPVEVPALLVALTDTLSHPVPDAARRSRLEAVVRDELVDLRPRTFLVPLPFDAAARQVAIALIADPADARPLDRLAAAAGTSTRTLQRRFSEETGLAFHTWRRRAGLQHAMTVLDNGGNVTQAALRCGFSSASAFIAAFRREIGITPAAWQRARNQSGATGSVSAFSSSEVDERTFVR